MPHMLSQSSHAWIEKDANYYNDDVDDGDGADCNNVPYVGGVWGICYSHGNGSGIHNEHRAKDYAAHASDNITAIFKARDRVDIQTEVHTANWYDVQEPEQCAKAYNARGEHVAGVESFGHQMVASTRSASLSS